MKVIFSRKGMFDIHESAGMWFAMGEKNGHCKYGVNPGEENHSFHFSPGAYDYAGWLEEVCSMVIDAKQIHVCDVDGDILCISTDGGGGRNEARLEKTGECYVGNNIYDGSEK